MIGSDDILQVSLVPASVQITDTGFSVQITVDNTSQLKVKVGCFKMDVYKIERFIILTIKFKSIRNKRNKKGVICLFLTPAGFPVPNII